MRVSFLSAADAELAEAVEYYNQQRTGLGNEFLIELLRVLERITRFPSAWPQITPRVRRSRLRRFPIGLLASVDDWVEARNLRNKLVHEYMYEPEEFAAALNRAGELVPLVAETYEGLNRYEEAHLG